MIVGELDQIILNIFARFFLWKIVILHFKF